MHWETNVYRSLQHEFSSQILQKYETNCKLIQAQDGLCEKCFKGDELLCHGVRPTFITSPGLDFPLFRLTPCSRLNAKAEHENKLEGCGIPKAFIDSWKSDIVTKIDGVYFYDGVEHPTNFVAEPDSAIEELFNRVLSAINSGYTAKLLSYPVVVNKLKNWRTFISDNLEYDLLIIHRYDLGGCPEFIADNFYELVNLRKLSGRVTIFVINKDASARNERDVLVYKEVNTWQRRTV